LLVDEVNIALKTEPETDEEILRETREALQYFTLFSTEETEVCPEARRHSSSACLSLDADV
jgi:DNA-directed RNA polymerase subunit F